MTGLLVSVCTVEEAEAALSGGADIIDIKDPTQGSLGAASLDEIWRIFELVDGRAPVSAALGELLEPLPFNVRDLPPLSFAKVGLAGCRHTPDWKNQLSRMWQALPAGIERVGVVYVDWEEAAAVTAEEVFTCCVEFGVRYLLFDTKNKSDCLTHIVDSQQSQQWQRVALQRHWSLVVAGSLTERDFSCITNLWQPAYVGVRGAACPQGRTSKVSQTRVASLKHALRNAQSVKEKKKPMQQEIS